MTDASLNFTVEAEHFGQASGMNRMKNLPKSVPSSFGSNQSGFDRLDWHRVSVTLPPGQDGNTQKDAKLPKLRRPTGTTGTANNLHFIGSFFDVLLEAREFQPDVLNQVGG